MPLLCLLLLQIGKTQSFHHDAQLTYYGMSGQWMNLEGSGDSMRFAYTWILIQQRQGL